MWTGEEFPAFVPLTNITIWPNLVLRLGPLQSPLVKALVLILSRWVEPNQKGLITVRVRSVTLIYDIAAMNVHGCCREEGLMGFKGLVVACSESWARREPNGTRILDIRSVLRDENTHHCVVQTDQKLQPADFVHRRRKTAQSRLPETFCGNIAAAADVAASWSWLHLHRRRLVSVVGANMQSPSSPGIRSSWSPVDGSAAVVLQHGLVGNH